MQLEKAKSVLEMANLTAQSSMHSGMTGSAMMELNCNGCLERLQSFSVGLGSTMYVLLELITSHCMQPNTELSIACTIFLGENLQSWVQGLVMIR